MHRLGPSDIVDSGVAACLDLVQVPAPGLAVVDVNDVSAFKASTFEQVVHQRADVVEQIVFGLLAKNRSAHDMNREDSVEEVKAETLSLSEIISQTAVVQAVHFVKRPTLEEFKQVVSHFMIGNSRAMYCRSLQFFDRDAL